MTLTEAINKVTDEAKVMKYGEYKLQQLIIPTIRYNQDASRKRVNSISVQLTHQDNVIDRLPLDVVLESDWEEVK